MIFFITCPRSWSSYKSREEKTCKAHHEFKGPQTLCSIQALCAYLVHDIAHWTIWWLLYIVSYHHPAMGQRGALNAGRKNAFMSLLSDTGSAKQVCRSNAKLFWRNMGGILQVLPGVENSSFFQWNRLTKQELLCAGQGWGLVPIRGPILIHYQTIVRPGSCCRIFSYSSEVNPARLSVPTEISR